MARIFFVKDEITISDMKKALPSYLHFKECKQHGIDYEFTDGVSGIGVEMKGKNPFLVGYLWVNKGDISAHDWIRDMNESLNAFVSEEEFDDSLYEYYGKS